MHTIFCVVFSSHCVKNYDEVLEVRGFHCIGGDGVLTPNELPRAGPGNAPKCVSLGLGGGVQSCLCVVFGWNYVKKTTMDYLKSVVLCALGEVVHHPQ